jgi:hypothetical protein
MGRASVARRATAVKTSAIDVARAARFAAAVSAGDDEGAGAILRETQQQNGLVGLALALAVRHVQVAGQFYDSDRQQILDLFRHGRADLRTRVGVTRYAGVVS